MSLKYYMLAPLIVPKLKKALNKPNLRKFEFLFNKETGEQVLRATDPEQTKAVTGIFDIKDLLYTEKGKFLIDQIDKHAPTWVSIYGIIDIEKKYFLFNMLNKNGEIIFTLKY
jgi:hypothetical protein